MIKKTGYCSVCSTQKEEERELLVDSEMVYCTNCGALHALVRHKDTPYFYLERIE